MSQGYGIANGLSGRAETAFTWSSGYAVGRARLNDGVMDEVASGSASAQASGQTLVIDMGADQTFVGFALLNHNLASGACAVRVRAADDAGITVNVATAKAASTITTTAPYEKDTVLQFPSVTRRYWEFTFSHTGTKTITIGEVMALSSITTLSRSSIYGSGNSERYVQNRNESRTGNIRSTLLTGPIRTMTLPFKDLQGTSQRDELLGMWRATYGGVSNLLFLDFIESTATAATAAAMQCLWGKLQETLGYIESDYLLFDVDGLKLVGMGRGVL